MFEHLRDSVFCSHHLGRVLLGIVSREWAQDTLDNDSLALPECMKLAEDGDDWDARLEEDELWRLRMQGL